MERRGCRGLTACTTVWVSDGHVVIVGRNVDHRDDNPLPGVLFVNNRGVDKTAFPIDPADSSPLSWRSRYGSVTFTFAGRDWPDGGMNEAGLIVEEMTLGPTQHPEGSALARIQQSQWIQYQLDSSGNVDDVLATLGLIEPMGGWHFLVADRSGHRAIIEYVGGAKRVYSSREFPVVALTNSTYEDSAAALREHERGQHRLFDFEWAVSEAALRDYAGRGLSQSDIWKDYSLCRFIRATLMSGEAARLDRDALVRHTFWILHSVWAGKWTKRSIVHDSERMVLHYRTDVNPEISYIRFDDLDFSAGAPVKVIDINQKVSGSIACRLKDYSPADNEPIMDYLSSLFALAEAAGLPAAEIQFAPPNSRETVQSYFERARAYLRSIM